MYHFLLVYDVRRQVLSQQVTFTDPDEAVAEYSRVEQEHWGRDDLEIVLLGADSIETVMRTHGHYFPHPVSTSRLLAEV